MSDSYIPKALLSIFNKIMAQYSSYRDPLSSAVTAIGTDKYGNKISKRPALSCLNGPIAKYHVLSKDNIWRVDETAPHQSCTQPLAFAIFEDNKNASSTDASPKESELPQYVMTLYKGNGESKENDAWNITDTSEEASENKKLEQRWTAPYKIEVHGYLKERQSMFRPNVSRMRRQRDISMEMRMILVDWMIEVAEEYNLQEETIHLAVTYTDQFISTMSVQRSRLQLVGTTALFVAAKHQEIYVPELKDFVYITDSTYSKREILRMEQMLLVAINFDLAYPTAHTFLQMYANVASSSEMVQFLAQYICDVSMLHADLLLFLPSETGAGCLALANCILEARAWPKELAQMSGYSLADIQVVMHCLFEKYSNVATAPSHRAVYDKYKSAKYQRVACIQCPNGLKLN